MASKISNNRTMVQNHPFQEIYYYIEKVQCRKSYTALIFYTTRFDARILSNEKEIGSTRID